MTTGRYFLVLAGFGSQRLLELAYSRRNDQAIRHREPNVPAAAPAVYPWIVLANLALFTLPVVEHARRRRQVPVAVAVAGWAGALAAAGLRLWVIRTLGGAWSARALVPAGLQVIDRGPYRYIRHPNYVALALEFAALPLVGGAYRSSILLSLVNGWLLRARIFDEERLLDRIPGYRERMGGKPRFLPRRGRVSDRSPVPAIPGASER